VGQWSWICQSYPPNLKSDFSLWRTGEGEAGQWAVIADPTAADGSAIAQVSKDRTDYRFPLAVYKPYSGKDVEVSVRFKPVAGTVDEAGGIAVRLSTPDDYYVARANALEDNVRFYRVVKGKREQLASANAKVAANEWHTLALKPRETASPSRLTAKHCSRRRTELFRMPARSLCGPRPTA
jgi:hypothetical protein